MKKSLLILALGLCLIAAGCGKKEEAPEPEEVVEEETVEYQVIGNASDTAYKVLLTNSTGQDIKGIAVKMFEETEYPANMIKSDEVFANETTAEVYYTPEAVEAPVSDEADSSEKAINIVYTVQITFADDTVYELSSFAFEDIKDEAELCMEDDVVFLKYVSKDTDTEVSTKEMELGAKAQKESEEASEEQQTTTNNSSSSSTPSGSSSSNNNTSSNNSSSNSGSTTPSQDSESCLDGVDVPSQDSESCLGGVDVPSQDSEGCLGDVEIVE